MTTTYGNAAYCVRNWPVLRCAPRERTAARDVHHYSTITRHTPLAVQLLACDRPTGILESAPRTSLRADSACERWDGFWCVSDEKYYARCVRDDSSEQWYHFADETSRERVAEARVLPLRRRGVVKYDARRTVMWLSSSYRGRPILVGVSRRGSPARPRVGAGGPR